ncbi:MAG: dioxygenase [Hirschia sp.]|nr:dioxygenase [Hirschia sp.]MBF19395.1 dioxygenase [Hirschia sp.]
MPRQPTFYVSHGGGPSFWIDYPEPIGKDGFKGLERYLLGFESVLPAPPQAYLVISAHWETPQVTLSTSPAPGMLYDYYGFPDIAYTLQHPAPGAPDLAAGVRSLLADAGINSAEDDERGFDHGVFVPMMKIDTAAQTPTLMMSLQQDLDPGFHIRLGQALAPLRDEGVVIIGSGSSWHNLRQYFQAGSGQAEDFDNWLTETAIASPQERNTRLLDWVQAPAARQAHPREEHLLPLMVAAGAAGEDRGRRDFHDLIANKPFSGYAFG